ncbi:hypothetical protein MMC17_005843 [Xylographa soralifera]|nr:hypothetical protein [Xylographa soralifera]
MSPALVEQPFAVPNLGPLHFGQQKSFTSKGSDGPTMPKDKAWSLPAGAYTPHQIVEANAPLLEVVLHHLGPDPPGSLITSREMLLDNLASNLALETRESSITIPTRDPSRIEMAKQAIKIGKVLIDYARNIDGVQCDPGYVVRSPCEGHLLKPEVSYLMFGPRSLRHLMQIYNEYLHQMVMLRDALLPFENFEDVIIPIDAEPASVVKSAKFLLAPELPSNNVYGFQYKYGVVLPAFVVGSNSRSLLRYIPAIIDQIEEQVAFQYELRDYYTADRIEVPVQETLVSGDKIDGMLEQNGTTGLQATLVPVPTESREVRHLQLTLEYSKRAPVKIDLGHIARGRRYAYVVGCKHGASSDVVPKEVKVHSAWKVLIESGPGLVMANKGIHLIQASNNIELLALLGKLYPENVIFKEQGQSLEQAQEAGKGLPEAGRFIVESVGEEASIMPS